MKNAHRTELEKELEKARKASSNAENADIEEIRRQHEYVIVTDTTRSAHRHQQVTGTGPCSGHTSVRINCLA